MHRYKSWIWGASAVALLAASSAMAAEGDDANSAAGVEEVVVTAQKRAENIQDVPLSIMAVSEKQMAAKGVQDATDLERLVPNLRLDAIAQQSGVAVRIRGFGAQSNAAIDPSVAPYVDGVFIPRPGAILSRVGAGPVGFVAVHGLLRGVRGVRGQGTLWSLAHCYLCSQ